MAIDNMNNYQLIFKLPDRWLNIPMATPYIFITSYKFFYFMLQKNDTAELRV